MEKKFVSDDFIVPEKLETDRFRLRMLTVDDAKKDYEAVMSSRLELRNPLVEDAWPRENMTLEEDIEELRAHQEEFLKRLAFTYTVASLDESRCLGCVYIYPSRLEDYDAEVYLWARTSELKNGLDETLYSEVRGWIKSAWPFKEVVYPGRQVSWNQWFEMVGRD